MTKVLLTGVGAPGTAGALYSLRSARQVWTVGVDINEDVVGRHLCDRFYQVPTPRDDKFLERILEICEDEHADVVLPQVEEELFRLSWIRRQATPILVSDTEVIRVMGSKEFLMQYADRVGVPTPKHFTATSYAQLDRALSLLGYPEKKAVVKPAISRGMIGLRVVDASTADQKKAFFTEKPEQYATRVKKADLKFLGRTFIRTPLMVMEYLPGKEYSVDVLSSKGKVHVVVPRTRDMMRTGITFVGTTERNEEIIEYATRLTEKIGLEYAHGYQFKLDAEGTPKILECNARVQGTMVLSTFAGANIIDGAIRLALDEPLPRYNVKWGTRIFRQWGAIATYGNTIIGSC
jgi:carbamoyl-phosphate synthase large subunit